MTKNKFGILLDKKINQLKLTNKEVTLAVEAKYGKKISVKTIRNLRKNITNPSYEHGVILSDFFGFKHY